MKKGCVIFCIVTTSKTRPIIKLFIKLKRNQTKKKENSLTGREWKKRDREENGREGKG